MTTENEMKETPGEVPESISVRIYNTLFSFPYNILPQDLQQCHPDLMWEKSRNRVDVHGYSHDIPGKREGSEAGNKIKSDVVKKTS